jgi:putative membrane protein
MQPGIKRFLQTWLINTLAVLVAVSVVPGLRFTDHTWLTPFLTSLVLGILNAFFRPILMYFALPLLIITLGLFTLVINALLLYLVGLLLGSYFEVDSFGAAFLGALIIGVVSLLLNWVTGSGHSRIRVERHSGKRPSDADDGGGPVIDI